MLTTLLAAAIFQQETFVESFPSQVTSFKMVRIPDGENRGTTIKGLYAAQTELPWEVYEIWYLQRDQTIQEQTSVRPETISRPSRPYAVIFTGFGHHEYPAICVSLNSAIEFCKWLSTKTGKSYRLPTRAEWEYLAGAAPSNPDETSWHWDNAEDTTHKVATKKANANGLFDCFGNVAEWTLDKENVHGVAGGSWKTKPADLKPGYWQEYSPKWNEADPQTPKSKWWLANGQFIGLRVVCTK
jgi:formylglycine-generating enzyme required for sulfatase activity